MSGSTPIHYSPANPQQRIHRLPSCAGSNNATIVEAGLFTISYIQALNGSAGCIRLKIYDKATAPNPAVDVPVKVLPIPQTGGVMLDDEPIVCLLGVAYALVTGAADNDNTAVVAADITDLEITYK